jgi:hypothetical protein
MKNAMIHFLKKILLAGSATGLFIIVMAGTAGADVLTFDDLVGPSESFDMPSPYGGLSWSDKFRIHEATTIYTGCAASGIQFVYNGWAAPVTVSGSGFNFTGAYLTSLFSNNLNIQVIGKKDGTTLYDTSVSTDVHSPTWFVFNYLGIDELVFISSGGTPDPFLGEGTHFGMDNFTYAVENVPVPATMLLFGTGLIGLAGLRRNKRK